MCSLCSWVALSCLGLCCLALVLSWSVLFTPHAVNTTVFIEFSRCAANAVETFALEPNLRQLLSRPRNW